MRLTRLKRAVIGGAALSLSAGVCAVVGLAAPAGAFNNDPTGNPTSPSVSYELDCAGSGLAANETAPFIVSTDINTTKGNGSDSDHGLPTGTTFGAAGAVSVTLSGAVLAPLTAALDPTTVSVAGDVALGSTDGTATGSYDLPLPASFTASNPGSKISGVTWASGTSTLNGNFQNGDIGDFVGAAPVSQGGPAGLPNGSVITAVNPGVSATITTTTTADNSAGGAVGTAPTTGITFTDSSVSTGAVFTTAGKNNGKASIGVTGSTGGFTMTATVSLPFTTCALGGYDASDNPIGSPLMPPGTTTAAVSSTPPVFAAGAYLSLVDTPPTANSATQSINVSSTGSFNLTATAGSYSVDANSFTLVNGSPQNPQTGNLTITQVGSTSQINYVDTDTTVASYTFQFNVCDTLASTAGGPVCSASPGTITVVVAPPTLQPLTLDVQPGALQVSCNAPLVYVTNSTAPLATCPTFPFPSITLNGLEQQVTATTGNTNGSPSSVKPGTIYISDNRGNPMAGWQFSSFFVKSGSANTNPSCANVVAFCDENPGGTQNNLTESTAPNNNGSFNGQIAPNYLAVSNIQCFADSTGGPGNYNPPNLNANATPTAGFQFSANPQTLCTATAGSSGGTFIYNATYTLTVPESVYSGTYLGTIQYLAA